MKLEDLVEHVWCLFGWKKMLRGKECWELCKQTVKLGQNQTPNNDLVWQDCAGLDFQEELVVILEAKWDEIISVCFDMFYSSHIWAHQKRNIKALLFEHVNMFCMMDKILICERMSMYYFS